mgnify:FL=1
MSELEGADELNEIIRDVNALITFKNALIAPVLKYREKTIVSCGFEKTPGANISHCFFGVVFGVIASPGFNATMYNILLNIKLKPEAPFIEVVSCPPKLHDTYFNLTQWIIEYSRAIKKIADIKPKF